MEAMLDALELSVTTAVPLVVAAIAAVGAVKLSIPLAIMAYRKVAGFFTR